MEDPLQRNGDSGKPATIVEETVLTVPSADGFSAVGSDIVSDAVNTTEISAADTDIKTKAIRSLNVIGKKERKKKRKSKDDKDAPSSKTKKVGERKNIRPLFERAELNAATKLAIEQEEARKERLQQRQTSSELSSTAMQEQFIDQLQSILPQLSSGLPVAVTQPQDCPKPPANPSLYSLNVPSLTTDMLPNLTSVSAVSSSSSSPELAPTLASLSSTLQSNVSTSRSSLKYTASSTAPLEIPSMSNLEPSSDLLSDVYPESLVDDYASYPTGNRVPRSNDHSSQLNFNYFSSFNQDPSHTALLGNRASEEEARMSFSPKSASHPDVRQSDTRLSLLESLLRQTTSTKDPDGDVVVLSDDSLLEDDELYDDHDGDDIRPEDLLDSSDDHDNIIVLSDDEETQTSSSSGACLGLPADDALNLRDSEGRVLVNPNHPAQDPDIFLRPYLSKMVKPHQIGGVRFMYTCLVESLDRFKTSPGFGCILGHSMGLGKTLETICFIDSFLTHIKAFGAKRVLCIVPINTLQNWISEFDLWIPEDERGFSIHVIGELQKNLKSRAKVIAQWHTQGGVLLMGYEMFRLLVERKTKRKRLDGGHVDLVSEDITKQLYDEIHLAVVDPGPDLICCDEGHRIKNASAAVSKSLKAVRTRRRLVLTGYPLQNNLLEYWCMVDFVRPMYLGTQKEFSNMFERPIHNGRCMDSTPSDVKLMKFRSHVLHSLLEGFVQRCGASVLSYQLPPKEENVLLIKMTALQKQLYSSFMNCYVHKKEPVAPINPIRAFSTLFKVWNHPDILFNHVQAQLASSGDSPTNSSTVDNDLDLDLLDMYKPQRLQDVVTSSVLPGRGSITYEWAMDILKEYTPGNIELGRKMEIMLLILSMSVAQGDKVLIFSQSLGTLTLMEEFLHQQILSPDRGSEKWQKNVTYYRLDGSTTMLERDRMIRQFNSDPSVLLFLLSTKAGSLGVNLVGANRVIIFDASWNPCHDAQAICRVYRYGQTKKCHVYRLITSNTLEKSIYDRQISKQGVADRVIDELNPSASLLRKDMETLLHYDEKEDPVVDLTNTYFQDSVLQAVCASHSHCLAKIPFTHESMLEDRGEQRLTKAEERLAKKTYEMERQATHGMHRRDMRMMTRPMEGVKPLTGFPNINQSLLPPVHLPNNLGVVAMKLVNLPKDIPVPMGPNTPGFMSRIPAGTLVTLIMASDHSYFVRTKDGYLFRVHTARPLTQQPFFGAAGFYDPRTGGMTQPAPIDSSNDVIILSDSE